MKLKTEVCADSLLNYSDHWVSCTTYLKLTQSKSTLNRTHTKKIVSPLKKKERKKKKKKDLLPQSNWFCGITPYS